MAEICAAELRTLTNVPAVVGYIEYDFWSNPTTFISVGVPVKASMNPFAAVITADSPFWLGIDVDVSRTSVIVPPQRLGGALGSVKPPE